MPPQHRQDIHGGFYTYNCQVFITVKPVLRDHHREDQIRSLKTGGFLLEGHLNYDVRPGEMKMWFLNIGGL